MREDRIKKSYENIKLDNEVKDKMLFEILNSETANINSNKICIMRKEFYMRKAVVAAVMAICILALSGTAYAAYKWMNAKQVAESFGENKLAEQFGKSEADVLYEESDKYRATYLGMVSGEKLITGMEGTDDKKSYIVAAVERKDGKDITYDDGIVVSPFVKGINPMKFNIYAMSGGTQSKILDGVLYFIAECDDLEIFADKGVYIAVMDGPNMGTAYNIDESTGVIKKAANYEGLNMLFEIKLNASKADPEAADKYLKELENDLEQGADETFEGDDFEGYNDLEHPEDIIEKATLVKGSEKKLTPDMDGMIKYVSDEIDAAIPAKAVKKNGIDTLLFYGDENSEDEILVFTYENGEYIGRLYTCDKSITREAENK